jgi:hypothetical protein
LEAEQFTELPSALAESDSGVAPRWWFTSEAEDRIVQAQERYVGWNWRRNVSVYEDPKYPGFEACLKGASDAFEQIVEFRRTQAGLAPAAVSCQLLYDNVIPLRQGDGFLKMSDVLDFLRPFDGKKTFGWRIGWIEPFNLASEVAESSAVLDGRYNLRIEASLAATLGNDGAPHPVIRLLMIATGPVESWDAVGPFFSCAHDYISSALVRITTAKARALWGME